MGELLEAMDVKDGPEVLDAIGDMTIYLMSYCNKQGFEYEDINSQATSSIDFSYSREHVVTEVISYSLATNIGRLAHHTLKERQGIRGEAEYHKMKQKQAIRYIKTLLVDLSKHYRLTYEQIINTTWEKVSKRDWVQNKEI